LGDAAELRTKLKKIFFRKIQTAEQNMNQESRRHQRVSVSIGVEMDFAIGAREARISDLSMGGCFIDSIARVEVGELLSFVIALTQGREARLCGEVAYVFPNLGFGLRFINLTESDKRLLLEIIVAHGGEPPIAGGTLPQEYTNAENRQEDAPKAVSRGAPQSFEDLKKSIQDELDKR
jgi:hypothetical protein